MDFIASSIQTYCEKHSQPQAELLSRIERETNLEVLRPRMLSGHLQGRFLSMISHMIQPRSILEIGTYTGYSALCLAEGLASDGRLITIESNEELIPRTQGYLDASEYTHQIQLISGKAGSIIPTLEADWDLVFVDADKESYLNYFKQIIPVLRTGAFLIFDNVLWSGKVVDPQITDQTTEMIRELNRSIHEDPRVAEMILPFRDGLTILRKL